MQAEYDGGGGMGKKRNFIPCLCFSSPTTDASKDQDYSGWINTVLKGVKENDLQHTDDAFV